MPTAAHSPKARLLGGQLRDLREDANLSIRDLAEQIGVSRSAVSRYEQGQVTPDPEYVARVLGALGIGGDTYDDVLEFAHTASEPNLIGHRRSGYRHLLDISELERAASRIIHVSPLVVPGPMQTRAYAAEVMRLLNPDDRMMRLEMRTARQSHIATRDIVAYIGQRVLHDCFGGPKTMAEQLELLLDINQRPSVTLRIIPENLGQWTLAHEGPIALYEFEASDPVLHLEHFRGPAFLYDETDVTDYREALDKLADAAMSEADSTELIASIRDTYERSID